jgi:hypothetical protein
MIIKFNLFEQYRNLQINENNISLNEYMEFLNDIGFFITLNTSHLSQYFTDTTKSDEIQTQFRKPVINGLKFTDMLLNPIAKNPKAIPLILNYIKQLLEYIEPRFQRYLTKEGKIKYLPKIQKLKDRYINLVQ